MNAIDFQSRFAPFRIISLRDIRKTLPGFSYRQLDRWEKSGHLRRIKRGFYMLSGQDIDERFLFLTANKIYSPSYVSLESALKFYGLIPEEVFQITSVSPMKTTEFETPVGSFSYKSMKPGLFWGCRLLQYGRHNILMAEPEKALLDYLYLHPALKYRGDFLEMRISHGSFVEHVNVTKFEAFVKAFESKALARRASAFLESLRHA